jgi:NarL family two-component system response regulator LiaR
MTATKLSVFLIEDSEVIRETVKSVLATSERYQVIGEAADGYSGLAGLIRNRPDLAIVDINMPGANGVTVVRQARQALPSLGVIMLTSVDTDEEMFASFEAGARGYILKEGFGRVKLTVAIDTVADGNSWLDPAIAQRVLKVAAMAEKLNMVPLLTNDERRFLEAAQLPAQNIDLDKKAADDKKLNDTDWTDFLDKLTGFGKS